MMFKCGGVLRKFVGSTRGLIKLIVLTTTEGVRIEIFLVECGAVLKSKNGTTKKRPSAGRIEAFFLDHRLY